MSKSRSSKTPTGSTKRLTKAGSNLLDRLSDWYATEIGQIDKAIERIENNRYGFCVACHQAIEAARLETAPEAEFCSVCEELRDGLRCL